VPTSVAALEAGASKIHTSKVVHLLVGAGLLTAVRGRSGGLRLALPAETISLARVIRHCQPELIENAGGRTVRRSLDSQLRLIIDTARQTFTSLLDRFTIADLVAGRAAYRPACADCRLLNGPLSVRSPRNNHIHTEDL
jgi:Rrf2 family nitric oxide-sensitive transcriptional repressor